MEYLMRLNVPIILVFVSLAFIILWSVSVALQLDMPAPTGTYADGQTVFRCSNPARLEPLTEDPHDLREVIALLWYPAEMGSGMESPYFPGLSTVSHSLIESGEVAAWEAFGLPFIRSHNLLDARPAKSEKLYPIVIFSPGNGTNVEFYTVLAGELASHGYVVVGLNHPYDVAAVELSDHEVATFYKAQDEMEMSVHEEFIAERIKVRTEDVLFTVNQLNALNADANGTFAGVLDLESVAVAGHSLGGITASEACKADARFRACLNLDGIQRGGPFSTEETTIPPSQPFLFLTKEAQLPPRLIDKFESMTESYWVVVHGATHESFTDGPLLQPGLLPIPNRADRIMSYIQDYTLAFLDQALKNQDSSLLSNSENLQDVSVRIYPSE